MPWSRFAGSGVRTGRMEDRHTVPRVIPAVSASSARDRMASIRIGLVRGAGPRASRTSPVVRETLGGITSSGRPSLVPCLRWGGWQGAAGRPERRFGRVLGSSGGPTGACVTRRTGARSAAGGGIFLLFSDLTLNVGHSIACFTHGLLAEAVPPRVDRTYGKGTLL